MQQKDKIYIKDWLALKPYNKHIGSDLYYLKICNNIYNKLKEFEASTHPYLGKNDIKMLSCFITSYLEDIISGTNIWNSFVAFHQEIYGKKLPFFDVKEYYENEPNIQDINFLIWYFFNTVQQNKFILPQNELFEKMSEEVIDILDEEYEYAPENNELRKFYKISPDETDYYQVRLLMDAIFFKTYLLSIDTDERLTKTEVDVFETYEDNPHLLINMLNENRDTFLLNKHSRLLALKSKKWASKIIGNVPVSQDIERISKKISGFFLYKGQDDNYIFLEHIASGKRLDLTKKSFDHSKDLTKIDDVLLIGMAKWKNEWWFSGIFAKYDYDPEIVNRTKNSPEQKMDAQFLEDDYHEALELLQSQLESFKKFNNGSQIAFMPANQVNDFIEKNLRFHNDIVHKKIKRKPDNPLLEKEKISVLDELEEANDEALVFFNPKNGIEVALNINSAFPLPGNKFYREENHKEHLLRLLISDSFSTELAKFSIDNCQNRLPFLQTAEGKAVLKDLDFFLRFWKKDIYHTIPHVTFI